ncbi:MAG: ROK family protein [Mangrovibacterium sp.]
MNFWDTNIVANLSGVERKQFLAKRNIIRQLYRNETMSIAELCKQLMFSTPTAVGFMNALIEDGFVEERGVGDSLGGRKPMQYGLKPNSFYVLGVDVGLRTLRMTLFSNQLECQYKWDEKPFDLVNGKDMVSVLETYIKDFIQELTIDPSLLIGIGLIMPGLINPKNGINYTFLIQETENLASELSQRLGRLVFLENDARARALAEYRHGAARNSRNAMIVYVGNGLGLGMVLDGKMHLGKSGFAGEFSHIPIENNTHLCNCGKVGCLETIASGGALVRMAEEEMNKGKATTLKSVLQEHGSLTPELIVEAALQGDHLSISLINKIGANLGKGVSYLVQILNPEKVVLVGRVSRVGDMFVNSVSQALYRYCIPKLREDVTVEMSKLNSEAGLLGAATIVIETMLSN